MRIVPEPVRLIVDLEEDSLILQLAGELAFPPVGVISNYVEAIGRKRRIGEAALDLVATGEDLHCDDRIPVHLVEETSKRDLFGLAPLVEPALGEQRHRDDGDGVNGESAKRAIHRVGLMLRDGRF